MNRHIQFVTESEAVLSGIATLFAQCRVYRACVVLGSSLASARDIFDVTFAAPGPDRPGLEQGECGAQKPDPDAVSRAMLRRLVSTYSDVAPGTAQRATLFVLVQCDRGRCPPGFAPRHRLSIRPRKDAVRLEIQVGDSRVPAAGDDDRLWFQSGVAIRGLRGVPLPNVAGRR